LSIHCTKRIWDHATQGGPALLLLLALADYADADGFAFPGQRSLAAKVHLLILDRPGRCSLYVILTGTDRQSLAAALDRARSFGADVPACTLSDALGRWSCALCHARCDPGHNHVPSFPGQPVPCQ
jgi:hypothetical protein